MRTRGYLSTVRRCLARSSRRLAVVAVVGVAGVAAAPLPSFAPAASFAVEALPTRESVPHDEPADAAPVQASSTPAVAPSVVDGVPAPALRAYRFAAEVLARTDPACGLDWSLLAAVGHVESDHGRYDGAVLDEDGTSTPRILGPRLDGAGEVDAIADTDSGALDADRRWDRAVGPMQFIPSTWAMVGSDADGDGTRDPFDLDDAALSAAAYLCAGADDLSTAAGQRAAVYRYNPSHAYVDLVLALAADYARQRVTLALPASGPRGPSVSVPSLTAVLERPAHPAAPPRVEAPALSRTAASDARAGSSATTRTARTSGDRSRQAERRDPSPRDTGGPSSGGGTTPAPDAGTACTAATGDPAPSADAPDAGTADGGQAPAGDGSGPGDTTGGTQEEPPVLSASGTLQRADDGTWSVGGSPVDFGDDAYLGAPALSDLDGADGVEPNLDELETLLGREVAVELDGDGQVVVRVNDLPYR